MPVTTPSLPQIREKGVVFAAPCTGPMFTGAPPPRHWIVRFSTTMAAPLKEWEGPRGLVDAPGRWLGVVASKGGPASEVAGGDTLEREGRLASEMCDSAR